MSWLFAVKSIDEIKQKGTSGYYAMINEETGFDLLLDKSLDDFRAEGFTILTDPEFTALVEAHDDALCGDWKEETEEQYEYALDVLPPLRWTGGGFYVSEPYTSNIYSFHQKWNGRFYTSLQRSSTPRAEIIESLTRFIESNETKGESK